MATKKEQKKETQASGLQLVKAIKNTLFKVVPIGGSCVVAGIVRSIEDETGQYGDYTRFNGDFGAIVDGQTYKSGKMYLPQVAADVLKNGFLSVVDKAPEGSAPQIEFKLRLVKKSDPTPSNENGFTWTAEPMLDPTPADDRTLQLLA
jgi:ribosomal protein L14